MPGYSAPGGSFALVDLRNMETQSQGNHTGGVGNGLFVTEDTEDLGSDYTLLGIGAHITEVIPEMGASSAWNSMFGVVPQGTYLVDYLAYTLTDGSDVEGVVSAKPLMPGVAPENEVLIHLAGHSVIWQRKVDVRNGNSKHEKAIRDRLQKDLKAMFDTEPDDTHWRKYLASLKEKTGQHWDDPDEDYLLTTALKSKSKKGKSRALAHSTTYTETWPTNGTYGSTITSQDRGWTSVEVESGGSAVVSSNQIDATGSVVWLYFRMDTDLSSSDTDVHEDSVLIGGSSWNAVISRKDSSATKTFYMYGKNFGNLYLYKRISGTYTEIQGEGKTSVANAVLKLTASGSTIEGSYNSIVETTNTDTSISSGTYCGLGIHKNGTEATSDNWSGGSLGGDASSLPSGNLIGTQGGASPFHPKLNHNHSINRSSRW